MADEYVWIPEPVLQWRVGGGGRLCRGSNGPVDGRASYCREPAVAQLKRGDPKGNNWWGYCGNHLFGRRIRNGVVESRVRRSVAASSQHQTPEAK